MATQSIRSLLACQLNIVRLMDRQNHASQSTFLQLGHLPQEIWSDHSTAATHQIGSDQPGDRAFNER